MYVHHAKGSSISASLLLAARIALLKSKPELPALHRCYCCLHECILRCGSPRKPVLRVVSTSFILCTVAMQKDTAPFLIHSCCKLDCLLLLGRSCCMCCISFAVPLANNSTNSMFRQLRVDCTFHVISWCLLMLANILAGKQGLAEIFGPQLSPIACH